MGVHRRRIRSIAVRVVVFLLLGAMMNVAVAIVASLQDRMGTSDYQRTNEVAPPWLQEFAIERDGTDCRLNEGRAPGLSWESVSRPSESSANAWQEFAIWVRAGWPLRALEGGISQDYDSAGFAVTRELACWPLHRLHGDWLGFIPARPIWPGFAINTLFYAAILWLLFAAPFTLRKWRRIRRGLCAKCAYPVGSSDVCTEYGAAISRRSGAKECSHG